MWKSAPFSLTSGDSRTQKHDLPSQVSPPLPECLLALNERPDTRLDTVRMAISRKNATGPHGKSAPSCASGPDTKGLHEVLRHLAGMRNIVQAIRNLALVDVPVLIEGETGTEIDFVAHEIHNLSSRRAHPFILASCAGITESGSASQFWGSENRTSIAQVQDNLSVFEQAQGGTVFLEEVHDIPFRQQAQLARMIRTHEITLAGQAQPRRVNVRLICGTRFNLVQEAAAGGFNSDLLYKIRVGQIRLPPLRERPIDIFPLTQFYLRQCPLRPDRPLPSLSDEATGAMLAYPWPGNLTELQSAIEFAALRCKGSTIIADDLPDEILAVAKGVKPTAGDPVQTERKRLQAAMQAAKGNRTLAARILGISRATLYRRLKYLGIATRR